MTLVKKLHENCIEFSITPYIRVQPLRRLGYILRKEGSRIDKKLYKEDTIAVVEQPMGRYMHFLRQ